MHMCTHVYMHVYMLEDVHISIDACGYVYSHMYKQIYLYTLCICVYLCMSVSMHAGMCICMYVHMSEYACLYIHACIHEDIYVCL